MNEIDTCGLELQDENELNIASYGKNTAIDLEDKELAAAFRRPPPVKSV